ncbi:OmpA family protein [Patescibacteria group bacterium]
MPAKVIRAALLLVIGVIAVFTFSLVDPVLDEQGKKDVSNASKSKGNITVAVDNWIGYFMLRASEMKGFMRKRGWNVVIRNEGDAVDYKERMRQLEAGEIDFAVMTVDSYILNAAQFNFPGVIVMVIDESKGGDAILANRNKLTTLDDMKGKNLRVGFTPNSPSHHFAKATSNYFRIPELLDGFTETDGSTDAVDRLLKGDLDVVVAWESDVSRALENPSIIKLMGTEDTKNLIVDILVVNTDFAKENPEAVELLVDGSFRALKKYRDNPDALKAEIKDETGFSDEQIDSMLGGVEWVNLTDNCEKWFGVDSSGGYGGEFGLADTIDATIGLLRDVGDFSSNPIPDENPDRLINASFLEKLCSNNSFGITVPGEGAVASSETEAFPPLSENGWNSLEEKGTLGMDQIVFGSGSYELNLINKNIIDKAVANLSHYPKYYLIVKGHTGLRGDKDANIALSQERADSVVRYSKLAHGIDPNRIRAVGLGGEEPLPRGRNESKRSYGYRLPRVELVLAREIY